MLIVVAHQKGGTSKTTIAFNLAVELNADCYDLDSSISGKTGIAFVAALRKKAGHKPLNIGVIDSKDQLISIIENDKSDKITVIDSGGLDSNLNRIALAYADLIVTPATDGLLEIGGLMEFSRILTEIGTQVKKELKAHVFPVRTSPSRKSWPAIEDICSQRDTLIFAPKPMPLYVDYADSLVSGMSVIEYKPKGKAANHMKEIANYIKNIPK